MWAEYMKTKNLQAAEMWKNTIESEGLPCKILPDGKRLGMKIFFKEQNYPKGLPDAFLLGPD